MSPLVSRRPDAARHLVLAPLPGRAGSESARLRTSGAVHRRSGLFGSLNLEWERLIGDPSAWAAVRRWAQTHSAFQGIGTPGDVVGAVGRAHPSEADELLLGLLHLAADGDALAARTVLQLMLPKAVRVARSRYAAVGPDEADSVAVASLWECVRQYPLARRPRNVAANLAMDLLGRFTRALPTGGAPALPADVLVAVPEQPRPKPVDAQVYDVLRTAVASDAISLTEARMLARVYGSDAAGRRADADEVADEFGLSRAALRQRCSRAVRRLAAVADDLAA